MTDPTEIARVAAGLTRAQREAVLRGTWIGCIASNMKLANNLFHKGLAVPTPGSYNMRMLDWTERGHAVRHHILREKSGG